MTRACAPNFTFLFDPKCRGSKSTTAYRSTRLGCWDAVPRSQTGAKAKALDRLVERNCISGGLLAIVSDGSVAILGPLRGRPTTLKIFAEKFALFTDCLSELLPPERRKRDFVLKSCALLQQCKKFDTLLPHASGVWTRRGFSQDFG